MIRFKVIKASRVLLYASIAVLLAVILIIVMKYVSDRRTPARNASASLVQAALSEAKTVSSVFALSASSRSPTPAPDAMEVEVLTGTPAPRAPRSVLIYHTHTHEAYDPMSGDEYEAVEAWRTRDADHSVVRVGRELARQLESLGFEVIHDTTDHENDALSTAYTRSLKTLEAYDRSFDLYIDLHRDAYIQGMRRAVELSNGETSAQVMLLIGNGNGFDVKPRFQENLSFARSLTAQINAIEPGLCKNVLVKDGRYNQHIGTPSILIEVGHNRNTLQEALNAIPAVARAIDKVLLSNDVN